MNGWRRFLWSLLYLTGTIDVPNELFSMEEENEATSSAGTSQGHPRLR